VGKKLPDLGVCENEREYNVQVPQSYIPNQIINKFYHYKNELEDSPI
jgi:hypothetical protein